MLELLTEAVLSFPKPTIDQDYTSSQFNRHVFVLLSLKTLQKKFSSLRKNPIRGNGLQLNSFQLQMNQEDIWLSKFRYCVDSFRVRTSRCIFPYNIIVIQKLFWKKFLVLENPKIPFGGMQHTSWGVVRIAEIFFVHPLTQSKMIFWLSQHSKTLCFPSTWSVGTTSCHKQQHTLMLDKSPFIWAPFTQ